MRKFLLATIFAMSISAAAHADPSNSPSTSGNFGFTSNVGTSFSSGSESISGANGIAGKTPTFAISGNIGNAASYSVGGIGANNVNTATTSNSFNLGGGYATPGSAFSENGTSFAQGSSTLGNTKYGNFVFANPTHNSDW